MSPATRFLITLLGQTDAVWAPHRDWSVFSNATNRYELQQTFLTRGLPLDWKSEGGETSKQRQRLIAKLADEASVTTFTVNGKSVAVRLTDAADDATRRLVGLPDVAKSFDMLQRITEESKRPWSFMTDVWIHESKFAPENADGKALAAVEDSMTPSIVRGLVRSASDTQGRVYYGVTQAGWKLIDATDKPPPQIDPEGEPSPELRSLYVKTFRATTALLKSRTPTQPSEIGFMPLPVSMFGLPCWKNGIER